MATHYIPRNVKGEGRILYIFSTKSLITTAVGAGIGFVFYFILKMVGLGTAGAILMAIFALLGFGCGTIKIPYIAGIPFTKNITGDSIDDIILRYIKFKINKKTYTYVETKEEDVNGDR